MDKELRELEKKLRAEENDRPTVEKVLLARRRAGALPLLERFQITNTVVLFFWDNIGIYTRGKRLDDAIDLAVCEQISRRLGWYTMWRQDENFRYIRQEARRAGYDVQEVLSATLYSAPAGEEDDEDYDPEIFDAPMASWGGIEDPTEDRKRVIEAELACQAISRAGGFGEFDDVQ